MAGARRCAAARRGRAVIRSAKKEGRGDGEEAAGKDEDDEDVWAKLEEMAAQKDEGERRRFDKEMEGENVDESKLIFEKKSAEDLQRKMESAKAVRARKRDEKLSKILGEDDVDYSREDGARGKYESDYDEWGIPTKYRNNPPLRILFAFRLGFFSGCEVVKEETIPRVVALFTLIWRSPGVGTALRFVSLGAWNAVNNRLLSTAKERREKRTEFYRSVEQARMSVSRFNFRTRRAIRLATQRKMDAMRDAHFLGVKPWTWLDRAWQNVMLYWWLAAHPNLSVLWTIVLPLVLVFNSRALTFRKRTKYELPSTIDRHSDEELAAAPGVGGKLILNPGKEWKLERLYPVKWEQVAMVVVLGGALLWGSFEATGKVSLLGEPFDSLYRQFTQPWTNMQLLPDNKWFPGQPNYPGGRSAPGDIFTTLIPFK